MPKGRVEYYSALKGSATPDGCPKLSRYEGKYGVAFPYDISVGVIPQEMEEADVLYSDLPWVGGYKKFLERAGVEGAPKYQTFLYAVRWAIEMAGKPAVMVTGKHAIQYLCPESGRDIKLNGRDAVALLWGFGPEQQRRVEQEEEIVTAYDLLVWLAERFYCVGDFCCGNGRAGEVFAWFGKRYVMSDINARCIGYISDRVKGVW